MRRFAIQHVRRKVASPYNGCEHFVEAVLAACERMATGQDKPDGVEPTTALRPSTKVD